MLKQIRHFLGDGTKVIAKCKKLCHAVPFQKLQLKTLQDLGGLVDEVENVCFDFVEGVSLFFNYLLLLVAPTYC